MNFILWTLKHFFNIFNERVDGGLRWYVYVYWGRRNTRMHTGILAQLFNIWVTGPCNPISSSKLSATLKCNFEIQTKYSNRILYNFSNLQTFIIFYKIDLTFHAVKVCLHFKSCIQNCSQHTARSFSTRNFARYRAYYMTYLAWNILHEFAAGQPIR